MKEETVTIEVLPNSKPGGGDIIVRVAGAMPGVIEHAISIASAELTRQGYGDWELFSGYERPDEGLFLLIYEAPR